MDDKAKEADDKVQIKDEHSTADSPLDHEKNAISLRNNKEIPSDENMDHKNAPKRKQNTPHEKLNKKRRKRIVVQEYSGSSGEDEYSLTVSNLPNNWTYVQIKNYIDKQCGPVDEIEMLKHGDFVNCAIRLTFQSSEKCKETMKNLQDKEVDGRKLELQMSGNFPREESLQPEIKTESRSDTNEIVPTVSPPPSTVDDDMWDGNPKDLYGLKPQFLKSLGIKPPLDKWVHVTNFRCDKSELRDVLELAGNVLMCSVVTVAHRYAKVMYSHPLEAVQAISMLHGQMFYGQALKVTMSRNPNTFVLPKGLTNIGLGLGIQGRPLQNISKQYSKYLKKDSSLVNPILFTEVDAEVEFLSNAQMVELDEKTNKEINELKESIEKDKRLFKIKNVDELDSYEPKDKIHLDTKFKPNSLRSNSPDVALSPNHNNQMNGPQRPFIGPKNFHAPGATLPVRLTHKPIQNIPQTYVQTPPIQQNVAQPVPTFRPGPFNPTQQGQFVAPQGNFGPIPGPVYGPQPMPGAFGARPVPGPQVPMHNMGPRPMMRPNMPVQGTVRPHGNGVTVQFANLPPTTTFPLLSEKLAHCGQVMSVQLTTPGCAVATFAHRAHAERCFQTYNGMNVEGYIINVMIM